MAKQEWGVKRTCQSCGARFYDMARSPIVCPKCGAVVEPEVVFKTKRQSSAVVEPKAVPVVVEDEPIGIDDDSEELEVAEEGEADASASEDGEEEEEAELIEDASDLGGDDDDMAEVMENIDDELGNEL